MKRNFTAERPGQLHVADFTYVPLDGKGFGNTAFCIDAFAGLIAGWECSLSTEIAFLEKAIRHAAALRARQRHPISGRAVHHSDAGSQRGSGCLAVTVRSPVVVSLRARERVCTRRVTHARWDETLDDRAA